VSVACGALKHATVVLTELLRFLAPADETLSRYFRAQHSLGPQERALIAEAVFAVLRRRRSLEAAAGSGAPQALVVAAAMRVLGFSQRALDALVEPELAQRIRAFRTEGLPDPVRLDLPDWLWERLVGDYGQAESERIAFGMLNAAPLDLRVNLARTSRQHVQSVLAADGIEAKPTPYSPAGLRVAGKPAINRHPLFRDGLVEVQD
jgi:16S rRNA (cytosine967-C5)-methyltransferase